MLLFNTNNILSEFPLVLVKEVPLNTNSSLCLINLDYGNLDTVGVYAALYSYLH